MTGKSAYSVAIGIKLIPITGILIVQLPGSSNVKGIVTTESNYPSSITLAMDHIDRAYKFMDNAYYLDDDVVDDYDFITRYNEGMNNSNSTILGVVLADIVDDILKEYDRALDVQFDLMNITNINMTSIIGNSSSSSMSMMNNTGINNKAEASDENMSIVNVADY